MSEAGIPNNAALAAASQAPTYVYCFIHGSVCYLMSMLMAAILRIFPNIRPDTRPVAEALKEKRQKLLLKRRAQARRLASKADVSDGSTTLAESSGSSVYPQSSEESDSSFPSLKRSLKSTMKLPRRLSINKMSKQKSRTEEPDTDSEESLSEQSKPLLGRRLSMLANIPAASGDLMSNMAKPFKSKRKQSQSDCCLPAKQVNEEGINAAAAVDSDHSRGVRKTRTRGVSFSDQVTVDNSSMEDDEWVDEPEPSHNSPELADFTTRPMANVARQIGKGARYAHDATARTMQDGAHQMQETARSMHQTTVRGMQQTTRQVKDATATMQHGTVKGIETTARCVKSTAVTAQQGTARGLEATARGMKDAARIVQDTTLRSVKNAGKSLAKGSSRAARPFHAGGCS
ncbi:hypothetical protein CERSUDRAFT_94609 [Gelatoporia subvermispora B]|uniref:Uncharacterized protein n=1 Tax=Ceriporiopsis subvermispora (strain B) TaxID=914234 RepID=M2QKQ3_CERS8|nr:hypothetical protein CERSUDRAFT_94609 [Gelatoporia subvermispora B]